jgi:CheY-like chemotaxis protein
MLRRRGHDVTVVDNGRAAVDAVKDGTHFDVILMDIQMPELDGLSATRKIRELSDGKSISIIAMTAHALSEERERFLAAGMDGYLAKPFQPPELFAVVEGSPGERTVLEEPSQPANVPVDVEGFRAEMRAAGVESAVEATLGVFMVDAPKRWETLTATIRGDDALAIREAAHAFKSACGTIRATKLHQMLQTTETMAADGDVGGARSDLPALLDEYERVIAYLREQTATGESDA